MKKYFITFCDSKFEKNRKILNSIALRNNFGTISYIPDNISDGITENKIEDIYNLKRGFGMWIWKPYIILETLKKMQYDEQLIYIDSGDMINDSIFAVIENGFKNQDILLVPSPCFNLQKFYTKRDCFVLMDCDSDKYWNSIQIEAGFLALKKTENNIRIIQEWFDFCRNRYILTDEANITKENFEGFVDHRHDQSILSNLATKYDIKLNNDLLFHIRHNVFFGE